jgi:hypothetical protein
MVIGLRAWVSLIGAFACFVFLISVFSPFLQAFWIEASIPESRPGPLTFWSFKTRIEFFGLDSYVKESWYSNYWFDVGGFVSRSASERWVESALILIFVSQILVLSFSALAILLDKRWLFLCSTIFGVVAFYCMWFVSNSLRHGYISDLLNGFWVTLPAALLFIVPFLISGKPPVRTK